MADNKSRAEYNNLVYRRNNAKNNYRSALNKKSDLESKISRLESVKKEVSQIKKDFYNDVKTKDEKTINNKKKWKGRNKTRFDNNGEFLKTDNSTYYKEIDRILDGINTKLATLKNELNDNGTLLSRLSGEIRRLGTRIENFFN